MLGWSLQPRIWTIVARTGKVSGAQYRDRECLSALNSLVLLVHSEPFLRIPSASLGSFCLKPKPVLMRGSIEKPLLGWYSYAFARYLNSRTDTYP